MKTVLITGGSSGIGYEMSRHFAKDGYRLFWVAKPLQELNSAGVKLLEEFPDAKIEKLDIDLCSKDAPKEVFNWIQKHGGVEVLINNAGIGTYGYLQNIPIEKELAMIQLNITAVYKLTRLFLDVMIKKNSGVIINISSIASTQPVPRMNTYAATKAFIKHFSIGLQEELEMQKSKVRIMTVFPAAISDTPFKSSGGMDKVKTYQGIAYTTAEEVGKDIWKGFKKEKKQVVTGFKMRIINAFQFLMPYALRKILIQRETEIED